MQHRFGGAFEVTEIGFDDFLCVVQHFAEQELQNRFEPFRHSLFGVLHGFDFTVAFLAAGFVFLDCSFHESQNVCAEFQPFLALFVHEFYNPVFEPGVGAHADVDQRKGEKDDVDDQHYKRQETVGSGAALRRVVKLQDQIAAKAQLGLTDGAGQL